MQTRVAAVFVFVSFTSLLSVAGVPALMREVKVILSSVLLCYGVCCLFIAYSMVIHMKTI